MQIKTETTYTYGDIDFHRGRAVDHLNKIKEFIDKETPDGEKMSFPRYVQFLYTLAQLQQSVGLIAFHVENLRDQTTDREKYL